MENVYSRTYRLFYGDITSVYERFGHPIFNSLFNIQGVFKLDVNLGRLVIMAHLQSNEPYLVITKNQEFTRYLDCDFSKVFSPYFILRQFFLL